MKRYTDPVYRADLLAFYLKHCTTDKDIKAMLADELRSYGRELIAEYQRNSSHDE